MTKEQPLSIGIRYGYDYSLVAYYNEKEKEPVIIYKDEGGHKIIPSCICVTKFPNVNLEES